MYIILLLLCVLQSRAGELHPQWCSRESDIQGAPASLLSREGGFQQGQGFSQTHGAGERAQHQAVEPATFQYHLNARPHRSNSVTVLLGKARGGESRHLPPHTLTVSPPVCVLLPFFYLNY